MKIVIEAFALKNSKSGTGRYAIDIISKLSCNHEVVVITREPDMASLKEIPSNVEVVLAENFIFVPTNVYLYFFLGSFLKKLDFDFAIFLIGCRPLFFNGIYDLVICDFNHKIFPSSLKLLTKIIYIFSSHSSIRKARNLISISEGTSKKSKNFYQRSADIVINPSLLKFKNVQPKAITGLPKNFSVYVGAIEPRKNISNLLIAHEYAVDSGMIDDKLLLVSSQSWFDKKVQALLKTMKHSELLPSVEENELAWIYLNAERAYMTTYYEGYGMPAAEAQFFGSKVICTDIIELREATKDKEIYVGTSSGDILCGIAKSLDPSLSIEENRDLLKEDLFELQVNEYNKLITSRKL